MKYDDFLKSLETEGGKVLVIIFMLMFITLFAAIMMATGHPLQEVGRELATTAVSSLLGILYGYLKAGPTLPRTGTSPSTPPATSPQPPDSKAGSSGQPAGTGTGPLPG